MSGRDDFLRPGDVIQVCGFFPKRSGGTPSNADARARRHVHGQLLVMPDGRLQSWGPYGKVEQCVRASDQAETWVSFFERGPVGPRVLVQRPGVDRSHAARAERRRRHRPSADRVVQRVLSFGGHAEARHER